MKLTKLEIAPVTKWQDVSSENPLRAVVRLQGETSSVECVLSDDAMRRMLDLCAEEIAASASQRVSEFVAAVSAIEGDKSSTVAALSSALED